MARFRNRLRSSSRWGGNGQEYDSGYQYRVSQRDLLRFGPWKRVWPLGERNVPMDTLQLLKDGVLRDEVVYPIWQRQTVTQANKTILATDEYGLVPSLFHVEFFRDHSAGDVIKARYNDGTTSGTDASGIVSNSTKLSVAPWQKYLYFGNTVLGDISRYSPVDHAFTTVASSPSPKFLFFLDNNLIAIYKSGSTWVVQWSVDSSPEDWAGAGSGSAVLPGNIGEVKGYGHLNDAVVIVGSRGAQLMSPTGGAAPAFKFDNIDAIRGTPYEAVTAVADVVYFIDFKRRLSFFDGNRTLPVGAGVPFFSSAPSFYPSARLGLLAVSLIDTDKTYFLDTDSQEWVSLLDDSYDFISDSPHTHTAGLVIGYDNDGDDVDVTTLDLDPVSYTQPQLETGRVDLGTEVYVAYVDVIRTSITSPVPVLRVLRQLNEGTIEISTFSGTDLDEQGTQVRFHVNSYAQFIELQFGYPTNEGPFLITDLSGGGNPTTNFTNPSGYFRGDTNANGNFAISDAALFWVGLEVNAAGNLVLEEANLTVEDVWLEDTGIEYMEVMLQRESNEPVTIR